MGSCFGKPEVECETSIPAGVALRLFGLELCPFTARIRIALQHKGLHVEPIWVSSEALKASKLEYLASVCPEGRFPVLQHGNDIICSSVDDILNYIDTTFPEPSLDAEHTARREWLEYVRDKFTPLIGQALYDSNPLVQKDVVPELEAAFAKLDKGIRDCSNGGPFFFGLCFSFVDVYLIPFLELVRPLAYFRGITIGKGNPHLLAYYKRMPCFPSYGPVRMDLDLLDMSVSRALMDRPPPALVNLTILQHHSILWHIGKVVELADELASTKLDSTTVSPIKISFGMKTKKLWKEYGRLLDLMQEHAQMEERIIFPVLEAADKGLAGAAMKDHARDLPVMNGIREDMKCVMTLQQGSQVHNEAIVALATRLRILQEYKVEHFKEEERELLPLLETAGVGQKEQQALLQDCINLMEISHARLFCYLLNGLRPHEIHMYIHMISKCCNSRLLDALRNSDEEFQNVLKVVTSRIPALLANLHK